MSKSHEKWKDIFIMNKETNELEHTIYSISSFGRVKNRLIETFKSHYITKRGYHYVNLHLRNNKRRLVSVARLVAMHFIPIPKKYLEMGYNEDDLVVDHIRECDPIRSRSDNSIYNLQWLTSSENLYKHTLYKNNGENKIKINASNDLNGILIGELNPSCTCTKKQIENVCKDLTENILSLQEIADKNNVPKNIVQAVKYKKSWRSVSDNDKYNVSNHKVNSTNRKNHSDDLLSSINSMILAGINNSDIINEINELYPNESDGIDNAKIDIYKCKLRNKMKNENSIYYGKRMTDIIEYIKNGFTDEKIYNDFRICSNPRTNRDLLTLRKFVNIFSKREKFNDYRKDNLREILK